MGSLYSATSCASGKSEGFSTVMDLPDFSSCSAAQPVSPALVC